MSIDADYIVVCAGSREGLLYGVQTLRQIIKQEGAVLPALEIEDYPDLPNRGFMHDVTRSRIPTMEQLKKLVDKCSYFKSITALYRAYLFIQRFQRDVAR